MTSLTSTKMQVLRKRISSIITIHLRGMSTESALSDLPQTTPIRGQPPGNIREHLWERLRVLRCMPEERSRMARWQKIGCRVSDFKPFGDV